MKTTKYCTRSQNNGEKKFSNDEAVSAKLLSLHLEIKVHKPFDERMQKVFLPIARSYNGRRKQIRPTLSISIETRFIIRNYNKLSESFETLQLRMIPSLDLSSYNT